jgi:hypothetical protein
MAILITDLVRVLLAGWPDQPMDVKPGDLTKFVPAGLGLAAPMVMMPWDNLESLFQRPNYYGLQPHTGHPLLDAPINDSSGGTVYFDHSPPQESFQQLLSLLHVHSHLKEYVVFLAEAESVMKDRFLVQMRVMTHFGLSGLFHVPPAEDGKPFPPQPLTIGELLWKFIESEQEFWSQHSLHGALGGDGDWARERLGFGFMVENAYQGVYRIWSRPWLITK